MIYRFLTEWRRAVRGSNSAENRFASPRQSRLDCSEVGSARHVYSEFVGHRGFDATRYGDWEYSGRCTDF